MTAERVRRTAAGREISSRPAAVPCAGSIRSSGRLRTGRHAMAGVRLTVKRVERAAEAHGAAASAAVTARARAIAARQVRPLPPDPQPDMLYIVIDGTDVLATGKETAERDGKGEDGRAQIREATR